MKKAMILASVLGLAMVITGCTTTKALNKGIYSDPSKKIGIAVATFPKARASKEGSQGMLDYAINASLAKELQTWLSQLDMSSFLQIKEKMSNVVEDGGLETILIDDMIDIKALPKTKNSSGTSVPDYTSLKAKYGVDYLVVLSIVDIGTMRKYYGFIPLNDPKAFCMGRGFIVNLADNSIQWDYTTKGKETVAKAEGKWDNPPAYPELQAAMQKVIDNSVSEVVLNYK